MTNKISKIAVFLNKTAAMSVQEFMDKAQKEISKSFPKSGIAIRHSTNLGSSISLRFTLGKDKSEWANGIVHNDPMHHVFSIAYGQIDKDGNLAEKIKIELPMVGGWLQISSKNPHLASDRVKIGWRKKTGTPEQVLAHLGKYFQKAKALVQKHKDDLPENLKNKV